MHKILTFLIAAVWMINGLFCKILNLVPRHQQIVARILGDDYAWLFTKAIGFAEILMAIWILSAIKPKWSAALQILIVALMNLLEFLLVPDQLLWGKVNSIFALLFIGIVYYHTFIWPTSNAKT